MLGTLTVFFLKRTGDRAVYERQVRRYRHFSDTQAQGKKSNCEDLTNTSWNISVKKLDTPVRLEDLGCNNCSLQTPSVSVSFLSIATVNSEEKSLLCSIMTSCLKGWQKTGHKNDGDYVGGYCDMELSWAEILVALKIWREGNMAKRTVPHWVLRHEILPYLVVSPCQLKMVMADWSVIENMFSCFLTTVGIVL